MKKRTVSVISISLIIAMLVLPTSATSTATVSIQDWHLVDSGKHLDWGGSTYYQSLFETAVTVWNNYKPGVIRQDTLLTLQDVTIRDYEDSYIYDDENTLAYTWPNGNMEFSLPKMLNLDSDAQREHVYIHELGHALGLDHNQATDVMYEIVTSKISLSTNDQASYDASYARY